MREDPRVCNPSSAWLLQAGPVCGRCWCYYQGLKRRKQDFSTLSETPLLSRCFWASILLAIMSNQCPFVTPHILQPGHATEVIYSSCSSRQIRKKNLYNYMSGVLFKYLPALNTKRLCKWSRDSYCSKLIFFVQYYANCINFILLLLQAVYPKALIR